MIRGKYEISPLGARDADFMRAAFADMPDARDAMAVYAFAYDEAETLSGCGRLSLDADGRFTVDRLYVTPEARGKGLGDLLARMLFFRASELGAPSVRLSCPPELAPFFQRYGLREEAGGDNFAMSADAESLNLRCH